MRSRLCAAFFAIRSRSPFLGFGVLCLPANADTSSGFENWSSALVVCTCIRNVWTACVTPATAVMTDCGVPAGRSGARTMANSADIAAAFWAGVGAAPARIEVLAIADVFTSLRYLVIAAVVAGERCAEAEMDGTATSAASTTASSAAVTWVGVQAESDNATRTMSTAAAFLVVIVRIIFFCFPFGLNCPLRGRLDPDLCDAGQIVLYHAGIEEHVRAGSLRLLHFRQREEGRSDDLAEVETVIGVCGILRCLHIDLTGCGRYGSGLGIW